LNKFSIALSLLLTLPRSVLNSLSQPV